MWPVVAGQVMVTVASGGLWTGLCLDLTRRVLCPLL